MSLGSKGTASVGFGEDTTLVNLFHHMTFHSVSVFATDEILRLVGRGVLNPHEEQIVSQHVIDFATKPTNGDRNRFRPAKPSTRRIDIDFPLGENKRGGEREKNISERFHPSERFALRLKLIRKVRCSSVA